MIFILQIYYLVAGIVVRFGMDDFEEEEKKRGEIERKQREDV